MSGISKEVIRQLMYNKKYPIITEFCRINNNDREETLIVQEYKGDVPRLMKRDNQIYILCPEHMSYVQETGIADSIANGTVFDDASLLDDQADYMQKTIIPMTAVANKHGTEPKKLRILITGVMGRINDDGQIEISIGDLENCKNFISDLTSGTGNDHVNRMCDHYLGIKNSDDNCEEHQSLPIEVRRDIHDLIKEIDSITDVSPEDTVSDEDFEPFESYNNHEYEDDDHDEEDENDDDEILDNEDEDADEDEDDEYDESYYIETTNVGNMTPEQKAKHEERKMHKTALRNAEKMGYDPNRVKRKKLNEANSSVKLAKDILAYDTESKERHLERMGRDRYDAAIKDDKHRLRYASEPLKDKRRRVLAGTLDPDSFLGPGSTVDASGRKHSYDINTSQDDSTGINPIKNNLYVNTDTLRGKNDFDFIHNHEVGHMAQYDHGLISNYFYPDDDNEKKSMGLAEDYAFKCAECFIEKYKSKLNEHDMTPAELHADYLSARKVGFNRAYKAIKQMYADDPDSIKTSGDYRALFIQDMMWLHKGQPNRCSMQYPKWTPEEKKAFMEFYIDEKLTENDITEMDIFKEYMTLDDTTHTEYDNTNVSCYNEGFFEKRPKKLKPIPRDIISYITIEMNAIKDSNDQAMIAGYCSAKLELVDFYLNCIDTQDPRYIVPHNRQYLVQMQSELNDLLRRILQIKPVNKYDRIWSGIL